MDCILFFLGVFYCCDKTDTRSNSGCSGSHSITKGSQGKFWSRTGTMQRPWKSVICLFAHGLLSLFSHSTQDSLPRDGGIHSDLHPPISIMSWERASRACPQANLMGGICSTESLSSDDYSLYQGDLKTSQHIMHYFQRIKHAVFLTFAKVPISSNLILQKWFLFAECLLRLPYAWKHPHLSPLCRGQSVETAVWHFMPVLQDSLLCCKMALLLLPLLSLACLTVRCT